MKFILILFFLSSSIFGADEIGRVEKVSGGDAYLTRDGKRILLEPGLALELNDVVASETSFILLHIFPGTQISAPKGTEIKLSDFYLEDSGKEKSLSVIDLLKGLVRVLVTKEKGQDIEQRVQTQSASFAVRGTEFEVSITPDNDVDLDVIEGQVDASSPYIQSFVPEIVKASEGLRFSIRQKNFQRRKLLLKFKDHPGFLKREQIIKKWKARKSKRKGVRIERRERSGKQRRK